MSITIDVLFVGLIAFVPNDTANATSMTAYLVKADSHAPVLEILGNAILVSGGAGTECSKSGNMISCKVVDTDIEIMNLEQANLQLPPFFRNPTRRRPD